MIVDPSDNTPQQNGPDEEVEDPLGGIEGITKEDDRYDEVEYFDNDDDNED